MARHFLILVLTMNIVWSRNMEPLVMKRIEACNHLDCDSTSNITVCGIRNEMTTVRLKLFENECALLKYGCSVSGNYAYGLIDMEYCRRLIVKSDPVAATNEIVTHNLQTAHNLKNNNECEANCNYLTEDVVCGIKQDGEGYRIKLFDNSCELNKYNCNTTISFIRTDMFICNDLLEDLDGPNSSNSNNIDANARAEDYKAEPSQRIIVVDGSVLGRTADVNETIENFFAATHVLDLPLREIDDKVKTRRMLLKVAGPVRVFQPWITIPEKIQTDVYHLPTLSTCYHKCPTQCPDTYSPVCGVPGILAREPSIMFQNHCYMDVAQCKMFWENKSSTAISSSYIESSFLFCLGDQLNGMYRFLPLIKTLQHMGRLRKKGRFHYKLHNMRFFNNHAYKEPKLMVTGASVSLRSKMTAPRSVEPNPDSLQTGTPLPIKPMLYSRINNTSADPSFVRT